MTVGNNELLLEDILEAVKNLNELLEKAVAQGFEWDATSAYETPKRIRIQIKQPVIKDNVRVF